MLIVGFGNPGPSYRHHRHNVGFMVLERLRMVTMASEWREKWSGLTCKGIVTGTPVTLLQPQTFMNKSGTSVQRAMLDLRLKPADVIVVHDELERPFGSVRARLGGGAAGHNGLRDTTAKISADFVRIRVGIGRPAPPMAVDAYVLSSFDRDEQTALGAVLDESCALIERVIRDGIASVAQDGTPSPKGQGRPRRD
ncbi:MAG: aminoacyl-tRNA hydrolase [Deltaproteobacteria bacterium]|nr:aminoacyl-tRNA hydrolase [Deltaproteobacteria bacterium]